jgi:RNA-dependent RNA polymerase
LSGLPTNITTFTIYKSFRSHGSIDWIELFENAAGRRENRGKIRFRYSIPFSPFEVIAFLLSAN